MTIKPQNNCLTNLAALIFLLGCCLIAFWPLTFHLFSLKNDALNYFLPVRHQVSEAIYNGYFPYWSPYFNLGYPLHGDMQSGVWNPFVQLFSLFGPYTLKTLQYETLLYVYLSGVGMYFLINHFIKNILICLLIATAYMLCGFNSDSAQFLNWISGASFLPFVILFYYRTITERAWSNAIFFGFFFYLLFSTAYPADFVILLYILFAIFIWKIIEARIYKNKQILLQFLKLHLVAIFCFLLLSLPAILSYLQSLPLTERGDGASYEDAMSNPLHPLLVFTYVTPLAAWKAPFVAVTDPLERNNFFGLITFALLIFGLLIKSQNKFIRFCKWALLITFIFSLGEIALLRPLTYYVFPFMDTFRHPANAKIFTIFFGCIIAAFALQQALQVTQVERKKKASFYIICFMLLIMVVWALTGNSTIFSTEIFFQIRSEGSFGEKIKNLLEGINFYDLLIINVLIQLPFLIALYFYFVKKVNLKKLVVFAVINSLIHTALFQPFTVVKKDSASSMQQVLNNVQVKGYPLPDLNATLANNSYNGDSLFNEVGTLNMYNKKIGRVDYRISPSNLSIQNEFWFNEKVRNTFLQYPLLYKADTALHAKDSSLINNTESKKIVLVEDSDLLQRINNNANDAPFNATAQTFTPTSWDIEIENSKAGFYNFFQSYYPNWQLYVDGEKQKIYKTNVSFMGFELKEGKHLISFRYEATSIKWTFYLNIVLTLAIIILGIYTQVKKKPRSSSLS